MGEHTSLQDRLGWITGMVGEGSPRQLEEAENFIASLSEDGYTKWLNCIVVVREAAPFTGMELMEEDLRRWSTLPKEVRDILLLAGAVVNGNRLTAKQSQLLTELQEEPEIPSSARWWAEVGRWDKASTLLNCSEAKAQAMFPHELRADQERRFAQELSIARAMDEIKPLVGTKEKSEEPAEQRAPKALRGTKYEHDRRRWPKT